MGRKRVGFRIVIITGIVGIFGAAQLIGQDPARRAPIGPIQAVTPQAVHPDPAGGEVLEGTWIEQTFDLTGAPGAILLNTFTRGGGVVGDGNTAQPTLRNAWHGTWVRTGTRDFLVTRVRWNFDATGAFDGRNKDVFHVLKVNETLDGYTGEFTAERFDRSGNLISTTPTRRVQAVRVIAEP